MGDVARKVAARYARGERPKTAAGAPPSMKGQVPPQFDQNAGSQKRDIPKDHGFDPKALKPLSKALFACSVALGHALTAHRHLSRIKSTTISPDGLLGGRGYVMSIADTRKKLWEASEALSAIADTLYDEIQAPHWQPKLSQLDSNTVEDIQRFVEESAEVMEQPEAEAEQRIKDIEEENDGPGGLRDPREGGGSKLPDGGSLNPQDTPSQDDLGVKVASVPSTTVDDSGGPRVDERGPATGEGPYGSYNDEDPQLVKKREVSDGGDLRRFARLPTMADLLAMGRGEAIDALAASALPTDGTPTEGYDFGLGFGAKGQGVENPQESLPKEDASLFIEDTTPAVELNINRQSASELPGDFEEPVARSDYFEGDRGSLVNTPLASSELPGEEQVWQETNVTELHDTHALGEDAATGYVRYDYSTPQHRRGPVHDPQKDIYQ